MTAQQTRPAHVVPATRRSWAWLGAGGLLGGAATLALVMFGASILAPPPPPTAMAPPTFVADPVSEGITHSYDGEFPFFVGGGVAAFDCDEDAKPELFLAGGASLSALYRNDSAAGGALAFTRIESAATDLSDVTGAYPLDVDSDSLLDLVVLRMGENVILRGTGDCTFERANETLGFDGGDAWTVGFSAQWQPGDTLPTMVFGNYLKSEQDRTCDDHALMVPAGDLVFERPEPVSPGWCTLSMLFSDWNRSGRMDLRVANDRHYYQGGQEQLLRLTDAGLVAYTEQEGWQPMQIWGMGIASEDLTGDGTPEVFLTSQGDNKLQALVDGAGGPDYRDIALERNATVHRPFTGGDTLPSTAWHPQFADVNNDGIVDLYVSKGNVDSMPEFAMLDPNNLLIGQSDGTFVEAADTAGILSFESGRGAAVVDLNLDGMLDIVQVNREANVSLWRNVGFGGAIESQPMGHWLAVRPLQDDVNRDAIGAWIEVRSGGRVHAREITIGGGHASGRIGWLHFGLGADTEAEVRVTWPDGEQTDWMPVESDRRVEVVRGAATVTSSP